MDKLVGLIKENWYTTRGCLLFNLLVVMTTFPFLYKSGLIALPVFLLLLITTTGIWLISTRVPKNKGNTIGIILAIATENKEEKIKLRNDLTKNFQDQINAGGMQDRFNVIEYPEYYASQVNSNNDFNYLNKSRSHFIIYGSLKKRQHEGKEHYFFQIDITVRHAPIPLSTSERFSKEMTELSPLDVRFSTENEFTGFEITKDWITYVTEYIIGIAAYITRDFKLSSELHMKLYNELKGIKATLPAIVKLKKRNKKRLIESLYQAQLSIYKNYRRTKEKSLLISIAEILDQIKSIDTTNYGINILRAIIYFLKDRDSGAALQEIKRISYKPNNTWRYSEAFLYAYRGDMDKATSSYKKAFKGIDEIHVPEESEEFIYDILDSESDKYQLWFCLGLINYFVKQDLYLARDDFEKFLASGDENEFTEQRRLAKVYIEQINKTMSG